MFAKKASASDFRILQQAVQSFLSDIIVVLPSSADCTLKVAAYTLFYPRMGDDLKNIRMIVRGYANGKEIPDDNVILIVDSNRCALSLPGIDRQNNGEVRAEAVEKALSVLTNSRIYIGPKYCVAYIDDVVNRNAVMHLTCALLPALAQWVFKDKPVTPAELAMLTTLTKRHYDEFVTKANACYDAFDFYDRVLEIKLKDIEKSMYAATIDACQRQISATQERINNLNVELRNSGVNLHDLQYRLFGLQLREDQVDSEIYNFFKRNRDKIELIDTAGNTRGTTEISFFIKTYLENWDSEAFGRLVRNQNSYLYNNYDYPVSGTFGSTEARVAFAKAIFGDDPKFRVRMTGAYRFNLNTCSVNARSQLEYPDNSYMFNPHIYFFSCLGDYERQINNFLRNGDTTGAIMQCFASAKSINVIESITFTRFMHQLYFTLRNCIELPDGTCVTPKAAYEWLIKEEQNHDTTQNG